MDNKMELNMNETLDPELEETDDDLFDEDEATDDEIAERSSMQPEIETMHIESEPQCVGCPYNKGAIDCEIFGEKPTEYLVNEKVCPREK